MGWHPAIRRSDNGIYGILDRVTASVRLDVEGPDDVAPLLGFLGDEPARVCGRDDKRRHTKTASRAFILGSARPPVDCLVGLSMVSAGVFCGAPTPLTGAGFVAGHDPPTG